MEQLRTRKESIEKLAREKAEKSAAQEAWAGHFAGLLPFILIACIMAVSGVPTIVYTIMVLIGFCAGWIVYSSIKPGAYKRYYEKYLKELTVIAGIGDKE